MVNPTSLKVNCKPKKKYSTGPLYLKLKFSVFRSFSNTRIRAPEAYTLYNLSGYTKAREFLSLRLLGYEVLSDDSPDICSIGFFVSYFTHPDQMSHPIVNKR